MGPMKSLGRRVLFFLGSFIFWNVILGIFNSPFIFQLVILLLGFAFWNWGGNRTFLLFSFILQISSLVSTYYLYHAILTWGDDD